MEQGFKVTVLYLMSLSSAHRTARMIRERRGEERKEREGKKEN